MKNVIKQRNWISKEDTSYPTMYTDGLILSCVIDATEGRYLATADILGSLLQTNYEKVDIHINTEGAMVTIIEDIDPAYYK